MGFEVWLEVVCGCVVGEFGFCGWMGFDVANIFYRREGKGKKGRE